jgi:hypothetical protein
MAPVENIDRGLRHGRNDFGRNERMHFHHDGTMPSPRRGRQLAMLAAIVVVAFAVVAGSVRAAPAAPQQTPTVEMGSSVATVAATKCVAKIQKGSKLVNVYEHYYKYKYQRVKGSKRFKRVIVKARRTLKVSCTRQCVRTKITKVTKYKRDKKGHIKKDKKGRKIKVTVRERVPVYKTVKKKVTVKRHNKLVKTRKKVRVYVMQKCKATSSSESGQPVKINLLDGSEALLDFGSFQRVTKLTGEFKGFVAGGFQLSRDNQITLTGGALSMAPTDVFIDDDCGGQVSASIRTGSPATVRLDPTRKSVSTVLASGNITTTAYTIIRLPLELRNDDGGCNQPYITTGYTDMKKTFFLSGKIESSTGLTRLSLKAAAEPFDVDGCITPGPSTAPCSQFSVPMSIMLSTKLVVAITFS